jgi:hypothetical protein
VKSEIIWSMVLVLGVMGIAAYAGANESANELGRRESGRGIASLGAPALREMPDSGFHLLPDSMRFSPGGRSGTEFKEAYRGPMQASHIGGGYLLQQNSPQSPARR